MYMHVTNIDTPPPPKKKKKNTHLVICTIFSSYDEKIGMWVFLSGACNKFDRWVAAGAACS